MKEDILELERELSYLPEGNITVKKINGNFYNYLRTRENGKRIETYISKEQAEELRPQIKKRKELEMKLKEVKKTDSEILETSKETEFNTYVRTGENLKRYVSTVKDWKKRKCFSKLSDYINDNRNEKVMILYGLRRTGKTTLIRQVIAEMDEEKFNKTAFIQIKSSDTLRDINRDLERLEKEGYTYVFFDEVTLVSDFIEGASLLSDIYAISGMKIVLTGTDSLGFLFSEDEQLYDRCLFIHTTFIPYYEFEEVLGIKGIDEFIRYGGTMSLSGNNYNENSIFTDSRNANEYVDTAIARNIQHSLAFYQRGSHFRSLYDLYRKNELTGAINRVVEDMNHRFAIETLTRTFKSNDLAITSNNLRKDRDQPTHVLDEINIEEVTETIRKILEVKNLEEQSVSLEEIHVKEIEEYLKLLDLVEDISLEHIPFSSQRESISVIAQPGLRYAQADALIEGVMSDPTFDELVVTEKKRVLERIRSEIKGRMMEEIVLLETKHAYPKKRVFKLQFAIGEFDMVVFDPEQLSCEIYEIKHSTESNDAQCRHLKDEKKCSETEHRYGTIKGRYVIYRGEEFKKNNIQYLNVEDYLKDLYR